MSSHNSHPSVDANIGYQLEATAIAFIAINTFFVALRLLSQWLRPVKFGWDDFWTIMTWPVLIVECCICIYVVRQNAIGYHMVADELYEPGKMALWGKWSLYVLPAVYVVASTLPKFAILALYLRVFPVKWVTWTCWVTVFILATAMIVNFFTVVFQCNPREKAWDLSLPGTCNDIKAHFRFSAIPNIFTDIVMLILPIPVVAKLQCPIRTRVAIIGTFLLGSLGLATALLRMIAFFTTTSVPIGNGASVAASTWDVYVIAEPSVYLISACLLTCRALINHLLNDVTFGRKTTSLLRQWRGKLSRRSQQREADSINDGASGTDDVSALYDAHKAEVRVTAIPLEDIDTRYGPDRSDSGEYPFGQIPKVMPKAQVWPHEAV